jgi:hypothetical protein
MMATRDDVTVRIDTELRDKAKPDQLDINLSRLLEDALRDEIDRRETLAATVSDGLTVIKLNLEDPDGRTYVGRFTGKLLGGTDDVEVYIDEDERVLIYEVDRRDYHDLAQSTTTLEDWLPNDPGVLAEVLHALGETPEIDI